jgi:hypothetical protein
MTRWSVAFQLEYMTYWQRLMADFQQPEFIILFHVAAQWQISYDLQKHDNRKGHL